MEQLVIAALPRDGSFGALLRACRHRAWLSQEQLAAQADVSERTVRNLEAGRVRSPRADTVRLLADALQLREPERASWFAAARGVTQQRAGPAAAGADGPAHARSDARSRRPLTACGCDRGNNPGGRRSPAGSQAEIGELPGRDDQSAGPAATDAGRTETAAQVSRAEPRAGTRSDGRLSSAERRELARLRRENRTLRADLEILKRATAILATATPGAVCPSIEAEDWQANGARRAGSPRR